MTTGPLRVPSAELLIALGEASRALRLQRLCHAPQHPSESRGYDKMAPLHQAALVAAIDAGFKILALEPKDDP